MIERLLTAPGRLNMAMGLPPEGNVGTGVDTVMRPNIGGNSLDRQLPPRDRAMMGPLPIGPMNPWRGGF